MTYRPPYDKAIVLLDRLEADLRRDNPRATVEEVWIAVQTICRPYLRGFPLNWHKREAQ